MPKYSDLKQEILREIREKRMKPGERLDGVRDLMEAHRVSKNTVSTALGQLAAEGVIELRHGSGIYLRQAPPRNLLTVGLILTEAENPFLNRFLNHLSLAQNRLPVNLITKLSGFEPAKEREAAEELTRAGAGAILLLPEPTGANAGHFMAIHRRGTPVVCVIRRFKREGLPYVIPDHAEAGRLAAKRLLAVGCRNLVYIGNRRMRHGDGRLDGFLEVAAMAGLPVNRRRVVQVEDENSVEAGERSFACAVARLKSIDGVMAFHDLYAAGVLRYCLKRGVRVPEALKLVGCDNLDLAGALTPSLTSVDYGMEALAEKSLGLLVDLAGGNPPRNSALVLPPRLILRESA